MDREERTSLRRSLSRWCEREAARLTQLEKGRTGPAEWDWLYAELEELGVLQLLFDEDTRHELDTVAETANCLAACSPSVALLVVQQNLAARLLGDARAERPRGWVALPLYDGAVEWRHQLRVTAEGDGYRARGRWSSIPALPIASTLLLPLVSAGGADFALVALSLAPAPASVARGPAVETLGLRGCPIADLTCTDTLFTTAEVIARGAGARRTTEALWSQAEVLVLAVRAGILERSYSVARDYAQVRWQGKKLIHEHSLVQRMLADLYGAHRAADERWRALSATLTPEEPLTDGQLSASAGFAGELARLASDGIQLLGGYGYMEEFGQERLFRDAKQCEMLLGHPQAKRFSLWRRETH